MTWNNAETKLKFTTYPMIHIGDLHYYERTAAEIGRCQYVLLEGVSWRLGNKRRPLWDLHLKTFYQQYGQTDETKYVAIIFGAGHMTAISRALGDLGFEVGTRRWVELLDRKSVV